MLSNIYIYVYIYIYIIYIYILSNKNIYTHCLLTLFSQKNGPIIPNADNPRHIATLIRIWTFQPYHTWTFQPCHICFAMSSNFNCKIKFSYLTLFKVFLLLNWLLHNGQKIPVYPTIYWYCHPLGRKIFICCLTFELWNWFKNVPRHFQG